MELPVVEVRDHAHAVVDHTLTGFPPAGLEPVMTTLTSADGLIAATPTFNASYSGLFKTLFDLLPEDALTGVPVLIAATGGTPRHSLVLDHALRPLFSYLRAVVVPTGVFAGPDDWAGGAAEGLLRERINRAATELADEVARPAAPPTRSPSPPASRSCWAGVASPDQPPLAARGTATPSAASGPPYAGGRNADIAGRDLEEFMSTPVRRPEAVTFRGTPMTLLGNELKVGDPAPDFTVLAQDLSPITLASTGGSAGLLRRPLAGHRDL